MRKRLQQGIGWFVTIAAGAVIAFSPLRVWASDDSVIGVWLPTQKSDGGLGTTFIFTKDGKLQGILGLTDSFTYKVKENKELILIPDENPLQTIRYAMKFSSNQLELGDLEGKQKQLLKRVDKSGQVGIVGLWTYKQDPEGPDFFMEFTESGKHYVSAPMSKYSGTYVLKPGMITLKVEGRPDDQEFDYTVRNDRLTLISTKPDKKSQTFIRKIK
jgi:hypothetical protein